MSALEDLAFDINTKTRPPILFSVMPDFIRHPESPEDAGCARSLRLAPPPFGRPAGVYAVLDTGPEWHPFGS